MKLGMVDYFYDNFGGGSATWVVWVNMRLVTSLSFFSLFIHSLIYLFLFLLSSVRAEVAFLLQAYLQQTSISGVSLLLPRVQQPLSILTTGQPNDITSVNMTVSKAIVLLE